MIALLQNPNHTFPDVALSEHVSISAASATRAPVVSSGPGAAQNISLIGGQQHSGELTSSEAPETLSRPSVVLPPPMIFDHDKFTSLQKWEGVVLSVHDETFWARILDLTQPGRVEEEAEFPREEVPPADIDLLREGGVFYWNIGYRDLRLSGQRIRASEIRFKRSAPPSHREAKSAGERAKHLTTLLGWK